MARLRNFLNSGLAPSSVIGHPVMAAVVTALIELLMFYQDSSHPNERHIQQVQTVKTEYDFIIIGGGSAGAVVASRLSENPSWRILLLEAGTEESAASDVPIFVENFQGGSFDWQYKAEPQPGRACLGIINGQCNFPRGKVLGGTSVLNYMLYTRRNRGDYDNWEELGNSGWGYENVLPYFRKSEDNKNPNFAKDQRHHGTGGFLTVDEPPWRSPLSYSFTAAGVELGYEHRDCNGARQTGFMFPQATMRKGTRCSTAKAFLHPVSGRSNLDISSESHVIKIIIDGNTKTAHGVKFMKKGIIFKSYARKEVILSAGALGSPQLLMLSGIGPAAHLSQLGIPVLADLPVGRNLMDHYGSMALQGTVEKKVAIREERIRHSLPQFLVQYAASGKGPLTSLAGAEGLAWINTKFANHTADRPDIEIVFGSAGLASETSGLVRRNHGLNEKIYQDLYSPLEGRDNFSFLVFLARPKSKGFVKLRSRNALDKPFIQASYFTHPEDIKVLVDGMKFTLELVKTEAFRKYGGKIWSGRKMPGCEHLNIWSDKYFECLARHYTNTVHHQCGTAKMGPATDPGAVVSPRLRVYGIDKLRVVDASIMPTIPSGNINAPTIMVGEKGSDIIKEDWGVFWKKSN